MHRAFCITCTIVLMLTSILCDPDAHAQDARRPKKLIATGWDTLDTRGVREHLAEMEQRPFDGVVLHAVGRGPDNKPCRLATAFAAEKWEREWFQPCVDDLRACEFQRFTDNFLLVGANPGNVDWFDDAGWQRIVEHWRIAAWAAKQSGCKGILFDPEPYTPPHAQFGYAAQPEHDRHSFADYCAKARQRGRETMQAMAAEYPNITVFCYFLNSIDAHAAGQADPGRVLAGSGYGLLPAFLDGWLDAAPPTVTLVDGCESAYRYNSEREFLEAGALMKGACQELVSPANRAKYRSQVQSGFGIYLDAYWNPKGSPWYVDGLGGPRVDRLRANVQTALRVADEYVWVYGEKYRWWPTPNRGVRPESWAEALPGSEQALRFARDPIDYAVTEIARLKQAGKLVNLARNGDFSAEKVANDQGQEIAWREGRAPAGWGSWQREDSHGQFTWDRDAGAASKGAAKAAGVVDGCFTQDHAAKPGDRYAVRAFTRVQGKGNTWLRIRWQTAEGRWTAEAQDKVFFAADPKPQAWGEVLGVVEVPQGVGRLVILLGLGGETSAEDAAWFDDVELYRLP